MFFKKNITHCKLLCTNMPLALLLAIVKLLCTQVNHMAAPFQRKSVVNKDTFFEFSQLHAETNKKKSLRAAARRGGVRPPK
jgi:hypothetical protein